MSMSLEAGSGGRGSGSQDFDLNLASIIDCFTVLIAFMLASATFLSIGILDAGVAAAGATSTDNAKPPSVNITVELSRGDIFSIKVSGKANTKTSIATKDGKWDYDALTAQLAALKGKWTDVNAITLSADNMTEYQDVVKAMEAARKSIPVVLLGGF